VEKKKAQKYVQQPYISQANVENPRIIPNQAGQRIVEGDNRSPDLSIGRNNIAPNSRV
jgi:hypothetical protein